MENYSVLMSVYYKEQAENLREAIDSILNQTVKTNEFIIVKDGPLTEKLDNTIKEYVEEYPGVFKIVTLKKNMGLAKALNKGIEQCSNEIIARMDSDDISMPDRMERQLEAMEANRADILSGTIVEFDESVDKPTAKRELPEKKEQIIEFAKKRSPFNHPAVMYKKSSVLKSGLYEDYTYFEDYNLWATMLNDGCIGYNVKEPVLYMRAGEGMYKRRGGLKYISYIYKFKKHLKDIYKCMFFRRISSQGAMTELLPIVLFLRLGTELSFGSYNTLFAIISIVSLQILKIINNKNINKKFYPYMAVAIFISSIFVVFNASFATLVIYYILMNSFGIIIESESCSAVYAAIKTDNLEEYRKEHIMTFNIYMFVGQLISYSLVYILYNYFYNVNILSITIAILMFFLIIATIYLRKTEDYLYKNRTQN